MVMDTITTTSSVRTNTLSTNACGRGLHIHEGFFFFFVLTIGSAFLMVVVVCRFFRERDVSR